MRKSGFSSTRPIARLSQWHWRMRQYGPRIGSRFSHRGQNEGFCFSTNIRYLSVAVTEDWNEYFWPEGRNRRISGPRVNLPRLRECNWRQPMEYPKSAIDPRDWIIQFRPEEQMLIFGRLRTEGIRFDQDNCNPYLLTDPFFIVCILSTPAVFRWIVN